MRWPVFAPEPAGVCVPVLTMEPFFAVRGRDFGGEVDDEWLSLVETGLKRMVFVDMLRSWARRLGGDIFGGARVLDRKRFFLEDEATEDGCASPSLTAVGVRK